MRLRPTRAVCIAAWTFANRTMVSTMVHDDIMAGSAAACGLAPLSLSSRPMPGASTGWHATGAGWTTIVVSRIGGSSRHRLSLVLLLQDLSRGTVKCRPGCCPQGINTESHLPGITSGARAIRPHQPPLAWAVVGKRQKCTHTSTWMTRLVPVLVTSKTTVVLSSYYYLAEQAEGFRWQVGAR